MQGTQWSVGDITVTRVESSNFVLPSATAMPAWSVPAFAPSVEHTSIAFSALVVKTPLSTIVVDPWLVDDGPRQLPVAEADAMIAGLLGEVAAVGAPAAAIDTVVLSHVDGIGWSTRPTDVLSLLQVDDPGADAGELDLSTATATRRDLLDELASRDGVLLTTLVGGPGGGVVQRSGSGYRLVT